MQKKHPIMVIPFLIFLLMVMIMAISLGSVAISPMDILHCVVQKLGINSNYVLDQKTEAIIWGIRIPRVLMSVTVGGVMGICGAAMQGLFRNPLADPSIIGISSGASLSAATVIVLGTTIFASKGIYFQMSALSIATFIGAILATLLIFSLSIHKGKTLVTSMLLTGIAINSFSMACTGLLTYISDDTQLRTLTFWTLGSLGGANWNSVSLMTMILILCSIVLMRQYKALNLLSLGEREAQYLGVSTESLKRKILLITALGVGTSVALCGMIGFVGLVIPHLVRLMGKADHRYVLPLSAICGANLLCLSDLISRTIKPPTEIPIGVITALIGAPFFLYLLYRQKKQNLFF